MTNLGKFLLILKLLVDSGPVHNTALVLYSLPQFCLTEVRCVLADLGSVLSVAVSLTNVI